MKKVNISLQRLTTEQILNDDAKSYNPSEWVKMVRRYEAQGETVFYKAEKGNGYDYDRFYAEYTIKEGIRILNPIGYSSCIHNGGFAQIEIMPDHISVLGYGEDGNGRIKNSTHGRQWMAKMSKQFGHIFSNDF